MKFVAARPEPAAPAGSLDPRQPVAWPFPDRRPPWALRLLIQHLWLPTILGFVVLYLSVILLCNPLDLSSLSAPRTTQGLAAIAALIGLAAVPYVLFRRSIDWTRHDLLLHREATAALPDAQDWLAGAAATEPKPKLAAVRQACSKLQSALHEGLPSRINAALNELDFTIGAPNPIGERSIVREYLQSCAIVLSCALLIRAFVLDVYSVPSSAMLPTLQLGDRVLVVKARYGLSLPWLRQRLLAASLPPQHSDVIVFATSAGSPDIRVGRVLAVPGDTMERCRSEIRINGAAPRHLQLQGRCEFEDYVDTEPPRHLETVRCSAHQELLARRPFLTVHPVPADADAAPCEPRQTVPPAHVFVAGDNRVTGYPGLMVPVGQIEGLAWAIFWSAGGQTRVRAERLFRRIDRD